MLLLLDWRVGKGICVMAELALSGIRGWGGGLCLWLDWPQGPCRLKQIGPCSAVDLHSTLMSSPLKCSPELGLPRSFSRC